MTKKEANKLKFPIVVLLDYHKNIEVLLCGQNVQDFDKWIVDEFAKKHQIPNGSEIWDYLDKKTLIKDWKEELELVKTPKQFFESFDWKEIDLPVDSKKRRVVKNG